MCEQLAAQSGHIIVAAVLKGGVVGGSSATRSLAREWLVRESVGMFAATSSFGVLDSILERTVYFLVETVGLHILFVDKPASDKKIESSKYKHSFNFARAILAKAGISGLVDWVESIAVKHQIGLSGAGARKVPYCPWDASVIARSLLEINHATIVAIVKLLAHVVDSSERFAFASSVIVLEVAPASVFVDSVKVFLVENLGDSSIHCLTRLD